MREIDRLAVVLAVAAFAADGATPSGVAGTIGRLADSVRGRMLDVVDPDDIMDRVDIDAVLDRVDVNALLTRVDVNAVLDSVDVDVLLDRVDVDRLLARMDVDAIVDRVDVERVVQRAGIPDIVAESTTSVFESALDLLRRQLLALDVILTRGVMRLRGHDDASVPAGPSALAGDGGTSHALPAPNAPITDVTGHYAGPVTRLTAHVLDVAIATSAFTVSSGALSSLLRTLSVPVDDTPGIIFLSGLVLWLLLYWFTATAVAGRTPGMAIVGLRIVDRVGDPLSGRQAFRRVLVLPFSVASVVGLIGIVIDRERRALHDLAAGSTVVYDWGDRTVTLPTPLARWLAQHAAPIDP